MRISVIIPVYNAEKYIAGCLDGMMRQTYRDLEIIVVNDCSTDGSLAAAERYAGVRIISFEQNRGPSAARNAGIAAATGDYIHFMDVDDAINDAFYERMAAAAIEADADVACCGMVHEPKPHRTMLFDAERILTSPRDKFGVTKAGVWSYVWRYLLRAEMLRKRSLSFEEGRLVEDMPFTVKAIYYADKVVLVPGAVYTYIRREGSLMQIRDKEHRRRRHRDLRHSKTVRHNFAREHRFKIPGVPSRGPLALLYVKWFT